MRFSFSNGIEQELRWLYHRKAVIEQLIRFLEKYHHSTPGVRQPPIVIPIERRSRHCQPSA